MDPHNASPKKNYAVTDIEVIVKSDDIVVRLFTLMPGERIPWHYHEQSTDHYFVLEGILTVETGEDGAMEEQAAGGRAAVVPFQRHQISNRSDAKTRFLLVQGVGKYDWIKAS